MKYIIVKESKDEKCPLDYGPKLIRDQGDEDAIAWLGQTLVTMVENQGPNSDRAGRCANILQRWVEWSNHAHEASHQSLDALTVARRTLERTIAENQRLTSEVARLRQAWEILKEATEKESAK